jgi:SAM-dependent methyltransferase
MGMQDPLTEQRLDSTAEIRAFMRLAFASAALNAALELGLFPELADEPRTAADVAERLGLPPYRCQCWLELLIGLGLLEQRGDAYGVSPKARAAILDAYSPPTWALLAREASERWAAGQDLATHITHPESVWAAQGKAVPNYVETMLASRERARRFTRMLLELHAPLAEKLADALDLSGASRMMDLGGGSGVMSHALLRRHPQLSSLVVDIAPVCDAGRAIADELALADRIGFHPADFLHDALPGGFDVILECDIAIHAESLYRKLRDSLAPDGRLIIVDWFHDPAVEPTLQYRVNAFYGTLTGSMHAAPTAQDVCDRLARVGYERVEARPLGDPALHEVRGVPGPTIIIAQR